MLRNVNEMCNAIGVTTLEDACYVDYLEEDSVRRLVTLRKRKQKEMMTEEKRRNERARDIDSHSCTVEEYSESERRERLSRMYSLVQAREISHFYASFHLGYCIMKPHQTSARHIGKAHAHLSRKACMHAYT